jgi:hypothetical protein
MSKTKFKLGDLVEVVSDDSQWNGIGIVEDILYTERIAEDIFSTEVEVRFDRADKRRGWFDTSYVHKVPLGVTYD